MKVIQGQCLQGCAMPPTAFMGLTTLSIKIPSLKPIEELDCLYCSRWNYTWWPLLTGKIKRVKFRIQQKQFKVMSKKHQYLSILQNQWRTTNDYFHYWLICPSTTTNWPVCLFPCFTKEHNWGAGNSKCSAFLLEKWLNLHSRNYRRYVIYQAQIFSDNCKYRTFPSFSSEPTSSWIETSLL